MKRKVLSVMLATAMTATLFAGCGSDASNADSGDATASTTEAGDVKTDTAASGSGSVYYLNFKPEQADQWVELAKEYTDETGVKVDVQFKGRTGQREGLEPALSAKQQIDLFDEEQ